MKRRRFALMLSLLTLLLTSCGGGASMDAAAPASSVPAEKVTGDYYYSMDTEVNDSASQEFPSNPVYQDPDAKLIREAKLHIQTTEFDQAAARLEEQVAELGGYFQNASLDGGSYRNVNASRRGDYIIRIPAEHYESFLSQSGELGYVTYRNESTQNIGEQYYDTEARLKTKKTKQERLLTLLAKAETMEDIITLESALSDVEYEIEQLSSTLNRYDSLVGFSTIRLSLDEVHKVTEQTGVTDSLGQRMSKGFSSSVQGLVEGVQDMLVWCSYHVFGILVFGAVVAGAVVVVLRRFGKKHGTDANDPPQQ